MVGPLTLTLKVDPGQLIIPPVEPYMYATKKRVMLFDTSIPVVELRYSLPVKYTTVFPESVVRVGGVVA